MVKRQMRIIFSLSCGLALWVCFMIYFQAFEIIPRGFSWSVKKRNGLISFKMRSALFLIKNPAAEGHLLARSYRALESRLPRGLRLTTFPQAKRTTCDDSPDEFRDPEFLVANDVFVDRDGRVLHPSTASLMAMKFHLSSKIVLEAAWYGEFNGGCCYKDWNSPRVGDLVKIPRDYPTLDYAVSLTQHHGMTFFHVMNEVIPRALLSVNITEPGTNRQPYMLVSDGTFAENAVIPIKQWVPSIGVDSSRLFFVGRKYPWVFVKKLIVPPPSSDIEVYPRCISWEVAPALMHEKAQCRIAETDQTENGSLLLLQRRLNPEQEKSCDTPRCMANFAELRRALEKEFDDRYPVVVFPSNPSVQESICMFQNARIVVGIHGAGFNNLLFVRPGTIVVQIGNEELASWGEYRHLAIQRGARFVPLVEPMIHRLAKNIAVNVSRVVSVIASSLADLSIEDDRPDGQG